MDDETGAAEEVTRVLVVEDERELADLYATWLKTEYEVSVVYDGDEALATLDEDVDVVLLDRHMPTLSGGDVVDAIRERGLDCRVAMVTAIDPDFDIVEMGFDEYLAKPVTEEDLLTTVDQLQARTAYDRQVQQYFALASKKAVLETEKSLSERETTPAYRDLERQLAETREDVTDTLDDFDVQDYKALFRDIGDEGNEH